MEFEKSARLRNLRYAIRGPVFDKAQEMQNSGIEIINLNIGNPAPFGFNVPDEIKQDIILNIKGAQGYTHHLGIFPARKAVMHYCQQINIKDVEIGDVFIGNGVSELIVMSMQALINEGDEILVPSPDYPLWTTSISLAGGKPVYYRCEESNGWNPNVEDIRSKITPRTKGIVVINPNNPTGAVYTKETLIAIKNIAEEHKIILFSDEIYDKILYDEATHTPLASLGKDTLYMTYGGLSKNYRAAGFRAGWLIISGMKQHAKSYIDGLTLLASMRLCANAMAQYGIQTALGGYQSINDLVSPKGRLYKQRNYAYERFIAMPGITCTKPMGALYLFPSIDLSQFTFKDDEDFVLQLLIEKHVLLVAGCGFNHTDSHHFRVVILADTDLLEKAIDRIEDFLNEHRRIASL
jgi:alanine-synthesizing transaminase